jgi:unsaturated rhamnogalacturonyl hydrolase
MIALRPASLIVLGLLLFSFLPGSARAVERDQIIATMEKAADWQLRQFPDETYLPIDSPHGWSEAVFWLGLTELAELRPQARYDERILALGASQQWRLGKRIAHADDHLIGQTWLWASANGAGAAILAPMRGQLDLLVAEQRAAKPPAAPVRFPKCAILFCWCDALFMSPPTLAGLSRATGDGRYADLALAETDRAIALLYDPGEKLFHRDDRFLGLKDDAGRRVFWSRGNGWVLAGLANLLRALDRNDPRAARYESLFRDMAGRVADLQRADGYWSSSMLDPDQPAETSGTALLVFALAWGVDEGLLDPDRFAPVVERGWAALTRAITRDGALGGVQAIGDRPASAGPAESQPYGTGALLLAGAQLIDMIDDVPPRRSHIAARRSGR